MICFCRADEAATRQTLPISCWANLAQRPLPRTFAFLLIGTLLPSLWCKTPFFRFRKTHQNGNFWPSTCLIPLRWNIRVSTNLQVAGLGNRSTSLSASVADLLLPPSRTESQIDDTHQLEYGTVAQALLAQGATRHAAQETTPEGVSPAPKSSQSALAFPAGERNRKRHGDSMSSRSTFLAGQAELGAATAPKVNADAKTSSSAGKPTHDKLGVSTFPPAPITSTSPHLTPLSLSEETKPLDSKETIVDRGPASQSPGVSKAGLSDATLSRESSPSNPEQADADARNAVSLPVPLVLELPNSGQAEAKNPVSDDTASHFSPPSRSTDSEPVARSQASPASAQIPASLKQASVLPVLDPLTQAAKPTIPVMPLNKPSNTGSPQTSILNGVKARRESAKGQQESAGNTSQPHSPDATIPAKPSSDTTNVSQIQPPSTVAADAAGKSVPTKIGPSGIERQPANDAGTDPVDETVPTPGPQVSTAQLVESASRSEFRVGMHSTEFGKVDIRTSMTRHEFTAQISVEHAGVAQALVTGLPSLYDRLSDQRVPLTNVVIENQSTSTSSGQEQRTPQDKQDRSESDANDKVQTKEILPVVPDTLFSLGRLDIRI